MKLSIHLLGEPKLAWCAKPYDLIAPPRTFLLLAYIVLRRNGAVARDQTAFDLWPDSSESEARANLRRHLYHLQRALPPAQDAPWLYADEKNITWNSAARAWIDVAQFETYARLRDKRARAVELYCGDLAARFEDEWLSEPRARLRDMYMAILGELIYEARLSRRFTEAAAYAEKLLACDPFREDTLRALMAIHYESGDRGGALHAYDAFERRLKAELAVSVMPETQSLRELIRQNAPLPGVPPRARLAFAERSTVSVPLIGRDGEFGKLRDLWENAAAGNGRLVTVAGEAGIGKTRLLADFALVTEAQGARMLYGTTTQPERSPYECLSEAVLRALPLLNAVELEPTWLGVVAQAVPELRAARADLPQPPPIDAGREQTRFFEGLLRVFEALAKPRPLFVILEDLHWAGRATLAALRFVARQIRCSPILLAVTYRDDDAPVSSALHQLRGGDAPTAPAHIALGRLSVGAVRDVLSAVPQLAESAGDMASSFFKRSEGNPLFLMFAVRDFLESADVALAIGDHGVRVLVSSRFDALTAPARSLVSIAAVIGNQFDVEVARQVSGWSEADLLDALNELMDRGFVRETDGRTRFNYAFSHHLVREAVYDSQSSDARLRRHNRIAHVMERIHADHADALAADLAYHFDRGADARRASHWYLVAGQQALSLNAVDEAMGCAERALELTGDLRNRFEGLALEEAIFNRRGDRERQREALDGLRDLAIELGDTELHCEAVHRRLLYYRTLGQRDAEAACVGELTMLAQSGSTHWRARALQARAASSLLTNDYARAAAEAHAALTLYRTLRDTYGEVDALCLLAESSSATGALEKTRRFVEQARARASAHQNRETIARATMAAAAAAFAQQDYAAMETLCREARELYSTMGDTEGEAGALSREGSALIRRLRISEAQERYTMALQRFESIGKLQGIAGALLNLAVVDIWTGRFRNALGSLDRAWRYFCELHDRRGQTMCVLNKSVANLYLGDAARAKELAVEGLNVAIEMSDLAIEAVALGNLGGAERDLGDFATATKHLETAVAVHQQLKRGADIVNDVADLALTHFRSGDLDGAARNLATLEAALQQHSLGAFWPHYPHWIAAQICSSLGREESARAHLKCAHDLLERIVSAISDDESRAAFLDLPMNRGILEADARSVTVS